MIFAKIVSEIVGCAIFFMENCKQIFLHAVKTFLSQSFCNITQLQLVKRSGISITSRERLSDDRFFLTKPVDWQANYVYAKTSIKLSLSGRTEKKSQDPIYTTVHRDIDRPDSKVPFLHHGLFQCHYLV